MSAEIRTHLSGMYVLPKGTRAWFICRTLELVECSHASEDGRFFLIDFPGNGAKGFRADADCVYMTNEDALEALKSISDYWSNRATFMHGVICGEYAKLTGKHFVDSEDAKQLPKTYPR